MNVAITGSRKGIRHSGSYILNWLHDYFSDHNVTQLSRETGYDFNENFDDIVSEILKNDVFVKLLSSTKSIGVLLFVSLNFLTNGIVLSETLFSFMFGRQSITNTQGSNSASRDATSGSIIPFPEKPRLIVGRLNLLPKMAGNLSMAIPALLAI